MQFRPFRTSAIIIAGFLIGAMWLTFHYDVTDVINDSYSRGWVDASIIMVVFTGLVTAITKLTDDGGKSDALAITEMHLDGERKDRTIEELLEENDRLKAERQKNSS